MDALDFMAAVIRYALPVFFTAMGVLLNQKAGIVNIGAEGMMLLGSFWGMTLAGSCQLPAAGFLGAMILVGLMGAVFAWLVYGLGVHAVVLGVAFNIFASGLCALLYRSGVGTLRLDMAGAANFQTMTLFFAILAVLLAAGLSLFLYGTYPGLALRTSGEYTDVAKKLGLPFKPLRYLGFCAGCMLIGLGGACLSVGQLNMFIEDMTGGRGYIALAAVCFGRFTPPGALAAVLIFGAGEAWQYRIQAAGHGIPHDLALMIPYVLTIAGLMFHGVMTRRKRSKGNEK